MEIRTLTENGPYTVRVSIPPEMLDELGLDPSENVVIRVDEAEETIQIQSAAALLEEA